MKKVERKTNREAGGKRKKRKRCRGEKRWREVGGENTLIQLYISKNYVNNHECVQDEFPLKDVHTSMIYISKKMKKNNN